MKFPARAMRDRAVNRKKINPSIPALHGKELFIDKVVSNQQYEINELQEMENIYKVQKQRLSIALQAEMKQIQDAQTNDKIWGINPDLKESISLLMEILIRIIQFKQDLGILIKIPQRLEIAGEVLQKEFAYVRHVIDELPLDAKVKMLELMEGGNGKCLQHPSQNT